MITNVVIVVGLAVLGFLVLLGWSMARVAGKADEALGYKDRVD